MQRSAQPNMIFFCLFAHDDTAPKWTRWLTARVEGKDTWTEINSCKDLTKRWLKPRYTQDLLWGQRGRSFVHRGQRRLGHFSAGDGLVELGSDEPAGGNPGFSEHLVNGGGKTQHSQEPGLLLVHGRVGLQSSGMQEINLCKNFFISLCWSRII